MKKTKNKLIIIAVLVLIIIIAVVYLRYNASENSRFVKYTYKTLLNIPETGLKANDEKLEKIIKYANKLEKKGDLESIRLCFAIKEALAITLFCEMRKNELYVLKYNLDSTPFYPAGFDLAVLIKLWEQIKFNEQMLVTRIPVEQDSVLQFCLSNNISYRDILNGYNFRTKIAYEKDIKLSAFHDNTYDYELNRTMRTSDEQLVQTLVMIQYFRDLDDGLDVYIELGFQDDFNLFKEKLKEKTNVERRRLDDGMKEIVFKTYGIRSLYYDISKFNGRLTLGLEPYIDDLSCLPEEFRDIFIKKRRQEEERKLILNADKISLKLDEALNFTYRDSDWLSNLYVYSSTGYINSVEIPREVVNTLVRMNKMSLGLRDFESSINVSNMFITLTHKPVYLKTIDNAVNILRPSTPEWFNELSFKNIYLEGNNFTNLSYLGLSMFICDNTDYVFTINKDGNSMFLNNDSLRIKNENIYIVAPVALKKSDLKKD